MKALRAVSIAAFLAAGAMAAFGYGGAGIGVMVPSPKAKAPKPRRSTAQLGDRATRKRGPGRSHAQVQRMTRKRRNQIRNKRAHRRAR